jgi:peptidoglycan hydrolase-like protein with peptidoglycan-binding domain
METASIRAKPGLVLDLQRGLAERGYYDGELDGLPGPRTQQAIREFEQAQGLNVTGEASEALLARVLQARARGDVTGSVVPPEPRPSTRVLAVQRVLARLGYGPVKLSGLPDPATKSAIENFERDRGLTKSGQVSDRLLKELSTVTGTPVE